MKKSILLVIALCFSMPVFAADDSAEKPTQHLKIADVTTMKDAKLIFLDKTHELMAMENVGLKEAAEIHINTYTLEQSVAYFAENLEGAKQSLAKEIAVVVENIHLNSEKNRLGELQTHLNEYFDLVDKFLFCF